MIRPTMWQKIIGGRTPRKCQRSAPFLKNGKVSTECKENAMFRTKIDKEGNHRTKDLPEYKYYCAEHTYL